MDTPPNTPDLFRPIAILTRFWPLALLAPLAWGIWWQGGFDEPYYVNLRAAQVWAGVYHDPAFLSWPLPPHTSPLFAAILSLTGRLRLDLASTAVCLSIAGWMATTGIVGRWLARSGDSSRTSPMTASAWLSLAPGFVASLGSEGSWIAACGWTILASLARPDDMKWARLVVAQVVLLLLRPTADSAALAALTWVLVLSRRHFPPVERYDVAAVALVWAGLAALANFSLIAVTLLIVAASLALDRAVAWLLQEPERVSAWTAASPSVVAYGLLVLTFSLAVGSEVRGLWQQVISRPVDHWRLEEAVAGWLHEFSPPGVPVAASQRVAYLAQRPQLALTPADAIPTAAALLDELRATPAPYVVSPNALAWQNLSQSIWFRLSYERQVAFQADHDSASPLTIWAFRPPIPGSGERELIHARVPDRLHLLGYQIWPRRVTPGEHVRVVLYLEAARDTNLPLVPFIALIRLLTPADGQTITQWEEVVPRRTNLAAWQPGRLIAEEMALMLPDNLEPGVYGFNLSLISRETGDFWPFSLDNDPNQLDRVSLGTVAVPWQGTLADTNASEAEFGQQIRLGGYTIMKEADKLVVTLFWQAGTAPDQDYVVFVHLLDENGELIASHDSRPANGRFPTSAWLPGDVIPDRHLLPLAEDLASGTYGIKTGLYLPGTGERLNLVAGSPTEQAEQALLLTQVQLP